MTTINRMSHAEQLLLAGFVGVVLGIMLTIGVGDLHASAPLKELQECRDEPDRSAWMGRRPGEAHSVESCLKIPRYGDPAWIPFMSHPLKQEGK